MTGVLSMAFGAALGIGGLRLALLGGSPYYLVSGLGYMSLRRAALAAASRRRVARPFAADRHGRLGALGSGRRLLGAVPPRLDARRHDTARDAGLAGIHGEQVTPNRCRRHGRTRAGDRREFALAFMPHGVIAHPLPRPFATAGKSSAPSDWYSYGRTTAGTRYAPFTQINRENVAQLTPAWTFRSGAMGLAPTRAALQIGNLLYPCVRQPDQRRRRGYRKLDGVPTPERHR